MIDRLIRLQHKKKRLYWMLKSLLVKEISWKTFALLLLLLLLLCLINCCFHESTRWGLIFWFSFPFSLNPFIFFVSFGINGNYVFFFSRSLSHSTHRLCVNNLVPRFLIPFVTLNIWLWVYVFTRFLGADDEIVQTTLLSPFHSFFFFMKDLTICAIVCMYVCVCVCVCIYI